MDVGIFDRFSTKADWFSNLLDDINMWVKIHMLREEIDMLETLTLSASMEIPAATTSVSNPSAAPTCTAAPAPSSVALSIPSEAPFFPADQAAPPSELSSPAAAPTAPAAQDPSPTALYSPAAASSEIIVKYYTGMRKAGVSSVLVIYFYCTLVSS
jgi:hypothetical protein